MKRTKLLDLLKNYIPSQEEQFFKEQIIAFAHNYENCFERSLEIGHITASCWLLNKNCSHALLTYHAKLNEWFQLGGHCDGNPDVLEVALKEAQEESGIASIKPVDNTIFDIDVHLIPENKKEKAHFHYDIRFLLQVTSDEQITISSESKDLRWFDKNRQSLPTTNSSVVRLFNKWVAKGI